MCISDLYERDTAECWKSRLPDIIDEHLPIINYASNCVDEYATGKFLKYLRKYLLFT